MKQSYFDYFLDKYSYERYSIKDNLESDKEVNPIISPINYIKEIKANKDIKDFNIGNSLPLLQNKERRSFNILDDIGFISYYTNGILRYEPENKYRLHRAVPSARGVHPNEIYFVIDKEMNRREEKVLLRYNPGRDFFELVKEKISEEVIRKVLITEELKDDYYLILAADLWRLARCYGNFSFNLSSLDAGHIISNIEILALRMGYEANIYYQFNEEEIGKVLDAEASQIYPFVTIGFKRKSKAAKEHYCLGSKEKLDHVGEMNVRTTDYEEEMNRMEDMQKLISLVTDPTSKSVLCSSGSRNVDYFSDDLEFDNNHMLLDSLYKRGSSHNNLGLSSICMEISSNQFKDIIDNITLYYKQIKANDFVNINLFINKVQGINKGYYTINENGDLKLVNEVVSLNEVKFMVNDNHEKMNIASMPIVCVLSGKIGEIKKAYGERGIQVLNMKVGELCHGISLVFSNYGYFSRPLKNYNDIFLEDKFSIDSEKERVVYQLILGKSNIQNTSFSLI